MRRLAIVLIVAPIIALLGCASAGAATTQPAHHAKAHTLTSEAPECISVALRYHGKVYAGVRFCGSGPASTPAGDSPLRDRVADHVLTIGWRSGECVRVYLDENSGNGPVIPAPFCGGRPGWDSPMRDVMRGKHLIVDGGPLASGAVILAL